MSYNHRVSILTTPTASIEYLYNAQNQRVAKKVNGTIVEKYLWSNLTTLLAIYDKDDNLIQRFEYSDGRMPTAMTQNNTKYYLHYDQVGSLRAVSDISGNIIKEITYDTYGNILSDTNANFKVPFGFAGGLYDSDTKLTRFGYRDYDSYTGKWTAKDPIDFAGGDTNLYGYVLGDPVNFVDPSGLFVDTLDNPIVAAAALLTTSAYGYYLMYTALDDYFQNHPIYWDFPTYDEPSSPVCESKGGKQNLKDSGLSDYSDDDLKEKYKDPNTPSSLKDRIKREQKARGTRNKQKRNK